MKRTERHHLKENELERLARQAGETMEARKREVTVAVIAIVVVGAAAIGYFAWHQRVESRAHALLAEAMARVHLANSVWLTLRASRVSPGHVIAVAIERSTPAERLDVFSRSHGLSAREGELLSHLAQGLDTREVAAAMFLSPHTVQDHLKAIFAKTGARSRRLLLARALG